MRSGVDGTALERKAPIASAKLPEDGEKRPDAVGSPLCPALSDPPKTPGFPTMQGIDPTPRGRIFSPAGSEPAKTRSFPKTRGGTRRRRVRFFSRRAGFTEKTKLPEGGRKPPDAGGPDLFPLGSGPSTTRSFPTATGGDSRRWVGSFSRRIGSGENAKLPDGGGRRLEISGRIFFSSGRIRRDREASRPQWEAT